jgi:hypothetical protein
MLSGKNAGFTGLSDPAECPGIPPLQGIPSRNAFVLLISMKGAGKGIIAGSE